MQKKKESTSLYKTYHYFQVMNQLLTGGHRKSIPEEWEAIVSILVHPLDNSLQLVGPSLPEAVHHKLADEPKIVQHSDESWLFLIKKGRKLSMVKTIGITLAYSLKQQWGTLVETEGP